MCQINFCIGGYNVTNTLFKIIIIIALLFSFAVQKNIYLQNDGKNIKL